MKKPRPGRVALDVRGLIDRVDLFRISSTTSRDPAVDAWLNDDTVELRATAREWFAKMRQCGDDVRESMHDGCPVACVDDAPFGYVNTFKAHVNVGFFYGAMLSDPARLLEGTGKRMRHVKLERSAELDVRALRVLIETAYLDLKNRLQQERASIQAPES